MSPGARLPDCRPPPDPAVRTDTAVPVCVLLQGTVGPGSPCSHPRRRAAAKRGGGGGGQCLCPPLLHGLCCCLCPLLWFVASHAWDRCLLRGLRWWFTGPVVRGHSEPRFGRTERRRRAARKRLIGALTWRPGWGAPPASAARHSTTPHHVCALLHCRCGQRAVGPVTTPHHCTTPRHNTANHGTTHGAAYATAQHTAQHVARHDSTAKHSTAQHRTAPRGGAPGSLRATSAPHSRAV